MTVPTFTLSIATPQARVFCAGDVESVVVPGVDGSFGILANHAPMMAVVACGVLKARRAGRDEFFALGNGTLEVKRNCVNVCVEAAEPAAGEAEARVRLGRETLTPSLSPEGRG